MDFLKLASGRFSVRKFKNKHLEGEVISRIIKAGHLAPTGFNYQPQRILVMNTDESIAKLLDLHSKFRPLDEVVVYESF